MRETPILTVLTGKRDEAARDFDLATQHNANDPDIFYHRAQLHFILSEFNAAATDYQKSIDLDSKFIFSHIQLGVTQYKMGSIASSMATFRRCIKNFGDKSDVYNYYGELLLDQQKYAEAVEKFETAVEMERKGVGERGGGMNVLPLINKALALFQWRQDFKSAEELCQKALISESSLTPTAVNHVADQIQSTRSVISPSQQWHSSYFNRARSPKLCNTSNAPPSSREQRAKLSMLCHMPRRRGRNLKSRTSTHS